MIGTPFRRPRRRAALCLAAFSVLSLVAGAAQRKPVRQENAPEVRAQILQTELSNRTLTADQRARLLISLAITDYRLRDFNDEVEVLEDALSSGTSNTNLLADASYYLGRTYQALGENEQAANQFDIVWRQYARSQYALDAAMQLGNLSLVSGDPEAATEWYHAIIRQEPLSKLAFLARDRPRAMSNGVSAAEIADESRRPVHLKDQFRLLDQYLYSQLYGKADSLAQQLNQTPTNAAEVAAMNYHLAHHYWMYGNAEGADRFITPSLSTTGDRHVQALILAGHVKRALGQIDAALGYYGQAIAAAPAEPKTIAAYQQSTRLLLRAGRESDALAMASAGEKAFGSSARLPAYLNRISTALRDGADPHWRSYAAEIVVTATNEAARQALMQLANDARLRRDWGGVRSYYQQLAARPSRSWRSNVDAQIHLLEAQLNLTNTAGAAHTEQALLSSVLALSATTAHASNTVSMTNSTTSSPDATPDGTDPTATRPKISPSPQPSDAPAYALYRLGKIWLANGYTNNAIAKWQQAASAYPSATFAGMAQINLAQHAEEKGDLTNAAALYRSYVSRTDMGPRRQLYAHANLIRVQQALGDRASTSVNLRAVKTAILSSRDAELQLNLAQYFWQHSDKALATELLQVGLTNALAQVRNTTDPHKRLWWEYLIARRLDTFGDYDQLAQHVSQFLPDLQNKALDDWNRYASYYLLIRALEKTGRSDQAQALCQNLVSSLPDDSLFVSHILYRMSEEAKAQGDAVTVRALAVAAFRAQPTTSLFAQFMYLETAEEDFNAGNYADALAKSIQLERAVPMSATSTAKVKVWAERFRWDCQYLHGRCLVAQGNTAAGRPLVVEALANDPVIPYAVPLIEPPHGTQ